ncbi:hypothetical protein P154DRAFT_519254 [Amniculicola lignicola CBS 123094]|uniref:Uncharacterized protein n=1 Tax=Amniculicola lignicola CBS 123094 TaxID=1392246 RepID=A0A6A5WR84_9PLEO|nr:hypothetical protein P154DRAFT_519254 [Amniculicola lignicola CBS 123094]
MSSQRGDTSRMTMSDPPSFAYPQNDSRLPPPGTACPKPICIRDASNKPKWWFNLTYSNPCPPHVQLHTSISSAAQKAWAEKKRGGSTDAKMAVLQAMQMTKEMKEISDGPRGKVYAVKKGSDWVLGACLEMGSMQGMTWRVLGTGVKAFEGWTFVLGEK